MPKDRTDTEKGKVAMKEGVKEELHAFCISAMDEGEILPHVPAATPSRKTSISERFRKRDLMHSIMEETMMVPTALGWGDRMLVNL